MASEGPIDLICLAGQGGSVIVRITGRPADPTPADPGSLAGEIVVDTAFGRGSIATSVRAEDLADWQEALDDLDTGQDIIWCEDRPGPEMSIVLDPDDDSAVVTIADGSASPTTLTVTVPLPDEWFDDAYRRLDQVLTTWPADGA